MTLCKYTAWFEHSYSVRGQTLQSDTFSDLKSDLVHTDYGITVWRYSSGRKSSSSWQVSMNDVTALWTAWFGLRPAEVMLPAKAALDLLMIGWIFVGSADCLLKPALGLHET